MLAEPDNISGAVACGVSEQTDVFIYRPSTCVVTEVGNDRSGLGVDRIG